MTAGPSPLRGDILILSSMAIFGAYALFIRLYPLPVLSYLFMFQVVGVAAFGGWALWKKAALRVERRFVLPLACLAVVATLNDLCYFYAFQETTVAKAAISHQMVSVYLLALSPLLAKERVTRPEWLSVLASLLGIVLLFSDKDTGGAGHDTAGIALGLASGFFYACIIILYRRLQSADGLPLSVINTWRHALSLIFLLPLLPLMAGHAYTATDIAVLAAFGIVFAAIAATLHCLGLGMTKPIHASILGKTEPVFAVIYACLFMGEAPSAPVVLGGCIIIGTSLWLTLRKKA